MAFKMKGFPLRSGFKHTGGAHEDHHSSVKSNNTNENVNKGSVTTLSTSEFEKNYADAKMKKAMDHYKLMMIQYNRQQNNPKIPDNEKMDKPIMPTQQNIGDFRADGSYGI